MEFLPLIPGSLVARWAIRADPDLEGRLGAARDISTNMRDLRHAAAPGP
ncbi:MAG TPA: hypothetical protein VGW40_12875 [Allosphingosinicella sp.]|nr:hypothetical protein [Allosphingosinicella sp.]